MARTLSGNIKLSIEREDATELESLLDQSIMEERENVSPDYARIRWMEKLQTGLARGLRPHMFKDDYTIKESRK